LLNSITQGTSVRRNKSLLVAPPPGKKLNRC
jgi:hypothetical protein